jgi:hypothetical protein
VPNGVRMRPRESRQQRLSFLVYVVLGDDDWERGEEVGGKTGEENQDNKSREDEKGETCEEAGFLHACKGRVEVGYSVRFHHLMSDGVRIPTGRSLRG